MTNETQAPAVPEAVVDPKAGFEQNDRKYPRLGTTIRSIWDWCDDFNAARGAPSRKELLDTLTPAGFHPATLATQYASWRKFHGVTGTIADPAKADRAEAAAAAKAEKASIAAAKKEAKAAEKLAKTEAAQAEKAAKTEAAAAAKLAKAEAAAQAKMAKADAKQAADDLAAEIASAEAS